MKRRSEMPLRLLRLDSAKEADVKRKLMQRPRKKRRQRLRLRRKLKQSGPKL